MWWMLPMNQPCTHCSGVTYLDEDRDTCCLICGWTSAHRDLDAEERREIDAIENLVPTTRLRSGERMRL